MRVLSTIIHIDAESRLHFMPMNANVGFGLSTSPVQALLKFGQFYHPSIQGFRQFREYLMGVVLMMNKLVSGSPEYTLPFVFAVCFEPICLSWPAPYVWKTLKSLPRRHQTPFTVDVRQFGKAMKKMILARALSVGYTPS